MTKVTDRRPANLTLDGGSLGSLVFAWLGDRYQHAWHLVGTDKATHSVLESVETGGSALWPISPPLQQIHQQAFDDGREVIFGVGMSGRGHWSASFTLVPELKCWIAELACRSPLVPESLGSMYRLIGSWQNKSTGSAYELRVGKTLLHLEPIAPSSVGVFIGADQLRLCPLELPSSPPSTTQWAFRLRCLNEKS